MSVSKSNVSKVRGKAKIKISAKREASMNKVMDSYSEEFDIKMMVIQELIPLGLKAVAEELQNNVSELVGKRYERGSDNVRWGKQNGSVYLRDQKFPIKVPRVRNQTNNQEVPLESYQRLQQPFCADSRTFRKLLHGLSAHRYHESSSLAAESFGISASNISKRFKAKSSDALEWLQNRSLSKEDIVAIFIDAKRYAEDGLMVAIGVTLDGVKIILGVEHMHSENSGAVSQWLDKLITRGLKFSEGILFIIDGSKGIKKGIKKRLGDYAFIQRCQKHKLENVVSYLDEARSNLCKHQMKRGLFKNNLQRS
ncbi:MAG: putative transposase [Candidatus Omnitrophota bacterium]|jgi:putative transposase